MSQPDEMQLFDQIKKGDELAFETIFHRYYKGLCLYANQIIKDDAAAEEIVQDLFVKIWEKRQRLIIEISLKNYLLRSVKNQCLNYLKHNRIKEFHVQHVLSETETKTNAEEANFIEIDLIQKIEESIESLPKKRREIFRLSREQGLKYREIAEKLGISIKTVETQMGLAIKTLREKLKDFTTFLTLFCAFLKK